MAHDVFIGYSSKDRAIAETVCATLEQAGIRCWIASRDIESGGDFWQEIASSIWRSLIFVLIFPINASEDVILEEVVLATQCKIPVIIFPVAKVKPDVTSLRVSALPDLEVDLHALTKRVIALLAERRFISSFETNLDAADRSAPVFRDLPTLSPGTPFAADAITSELPGQRVDRTYFSLTAPEYLGPASSCEIYVWAHLDQDRSAVVKRAREVTEQSIVVKSKGPVTLARGAVLTVCLRVDGLTVDSPEETILWDGEIGNAVFVVFVPPDATGAKKGTAVFYVAGLQIARLPFVLQIGAALGAHTSLSFQDQRVHKAFASYATADRDEVLARIQGVQKVAPSMEIFMDVLRLRSGQDWGQEIRRLIPLNDVFYLFWSVAAMNSRWVEQEWRCALETRGLDFIDPFPLVDPKLAPPPPELASKHFNEWTLAFLRKPAAN
jgi:hypothetical protein